MRQIERLSHSSVEKFYKDRDKFFTRYLLEDPIREATTPAMVVGSCFDYYAKIELGRIFENNKDAFVTYEEVCEQIPEELLTEGLRVGLECFTFYSDCGALSDLIDDIDHIVCSECELLDYIHPSIKHKMIGYPDLAYIDKTQRKIMLDFKVNGRYSKSPPSPVKGYVKLWDGENVTSYRDHRIVDGINIEEDLIWNGSGVSWMNQLTIYAKLLGWNKGWIGRIHQFVCNQKKGTIRVASHARVFTDLDNEKVIERIRYCSEAVLTGNIFTDVFYKELINDIDIEDAICDFTEIQTQAETMNKEYLERMESYYTAEDFLEFEEML